MVDGRSYSDALVRCGEVILDLDVLCIIVFDALEHMTSRTSDARTNSGSNTNTNTTNLILDVMGVSGHEEPTSGIIFLLHYIVNGNVMNVVDETFGTVTVALQITSPECATLLYRRNIIIFLICRLTDIT